MSGFYGSPLYPTKDIVDTGDKVEKLFGWLDDYEDTGPVIFYYKDPKSGEGYKLIAGEGVDLIITDENEKSITVCMTMKPFSSSSTSTSSVDETDI